jgi:hypothetical protein
MRSYQHAASIAGNKKQSMANHNVVDRRESCGRICFVVADWDAHSASSCALVPS